MNSQAPTRPKCAKKYGKNYVALLARVLRGRWRGLPPGSDLAYTSWRYSRGG